MITIILGTIYTLGLSATMLHHSETFVEQEFRNIEAGRETSGWMTLMLSTWTCLAAVLWPVYWTGRALYTVPERLALTAGEPQ